MGINSLRSLLIAAIVLCNCVPWIASRHHFKHNVNGHRSRHRRQGAGLFLPASYVIPGGEGGGAWGEWGEVSPCSRTCGGGVAKQKRICLEVGPDGEPLCKGGDTKYFSCQTQDCPEDALDFRSEQCADYNDRPYKGIKYKWVPFTNSQNPCQLNCMPHAERFYVPMKPKVVDGTRCNDESFDVCVDGVCQPVGCDMMLGSDAREDKCRNCRGNGTNCHTISGLIDSIEYKYGYNPVLLIPQGATNIIVAEVRSSSNYLALRAQNEDVYYLNGDYRIDFPRSLMIAGTLWHYERSQQGFAAPDKLRCLGPTTEPLYVYILLQEENVGIEYEYSVPSALAPPPNQSYNWTFSKFSECNATCGGGYQYRQVTCRSRDDLTEVDDNLCDVNFKPPSNQSCNVDACPPTWVVGPWGACSKPCGQGGSRSREVYCEKIITNGVTFRFKSKVADKECFDLLGPKPEAFQECNQNETCPTWFTGPWTHCDKLCGTGKQTRQVICHQRVNGRVDVFEDKECDEEKPAEEQECMLHPCDGVDWVLSEWTGCDTCLSKVRSRTAQCVTKSHKVINSSFCAYHPTPTLEEPCDPDKLPVCEMLWYASQWSNCSVQCGKGVQTRDVFCGNYDGESVTRVDDSKCDPETKFKTEKECEVPIEKCPAKWFAGAWSECSKPCGGGDRTRVVMCLDGEEESVACPGELLLDLSRRCNEGPCDEDETVPIDSKSTPIIEEYDYEDCEDEDEYPDESAEEAVTYFPPSILLIARKEKKSTLEPKITTDEGSGFTEWDESTVSGSTFEGSGFTEWEETSETETSTGSTESTDEYTGSTIESTTGETTGTNAEVTDSTELEESTSDTSEVDTTGMTGPDTDGSGSTDITESSESTTESGTSTSSSETSESITTESVIGTGTTESLAETSESSTTENVTGTGTTESLAETSESSTTENVTGTGTTESLAKETTELDLTTELSTTEATETETTESGATETTETDLTGTTESSSSESTTQPGTADTSETSSTETSESDATETTELGDTSTTESGPSESTTEPGTRDTCETSSTGTSEVSTTELSQTTESGTTESFESTSESTTELGTTDTSGSEASITELSTTDSGTTESTESSTTESSLAETTELAATGTSESTSDSSTELSSTESSTFSSETTELSTTESTGSSFTEITDLSTTESSESTTESGTTESTEMETLPTTESGPTSETTESGSTETTESGSTETTPWIWTSMKPKRGRCKPRKTAKCKKSTFGCCPDKKTPAKGPFDEGCPNPVTCKESKHGCCPDGVSPASGPQNEGCETTPCNQTLYGCCKSDNITAAEGNDQEGCPPPPPACKSSKYGCCEDENTEAKGPEGEGCPEKETTSTENPTTPSALITSTEAGGCETTEFGCCYDNETDASGPDGEGCPCSISEFGCCPDGVATAQGANLEGCILSCHTSAYGCCPDGETPAHGPEHEGCCLLTEFGCCPDNYKPALGPHLEGCECQSSHFGCCPDNVSIAHGPNNEGCGCQYTKFGCCPDKRTEAQGPEFEGCACHTYQFGCCPDGVTKVIGPNLQGCLCRDTTYGCCGDDVTAAKGPNKEGCDCSNSKFGCCPDGVTEAKGEKFLNCSDKPENKQAACGLPQDKGPCSNFSVYWFYDVSYGGCVRFWYGGCEGNGNRFVSQEECEDVCVRPPPKESCDLPQVKGICAGYNIRWYYDGAREQCSQFVYGGCLGNNNNFDSQQLCQERCEPDKSADQCTLPIEQGSCAGNFVRWGYNAQRRCCEQFVWGGCEGNTNRFSSEAACLLRCNPPGAPIQACSLPQEKGTCTEKHPAWSFSPTENRCMPFYYTGCGGNDNRFDSEQACASACPSAYVQEMCTLPAVTGDCAEYTRRWYYDTEHRRCREFYYGGCGGNENNFVSEFECENRCMEQIVTTTVAPTMQPTPAPGQQPRPDADFCLERIDPGPCSELQERWGYDAARGACTQFQYGGCGGNRNNFPSLEYCQYYCSPAQDVCQLPMRAGPCDGSLMRWFYDAATDSCSQFTYGGCEGNGNRFDSLGECERQCRSRADTATTTTTSTTTIAPEYLPPECQVSPTLEECSAAGEVWYWDELQRACVVHINGYSGLACRNTGVYPSQEACERSCGAFRDLDVCRYQVDPGPCDESIPKIYFDYATGRCEQFLYGGCHGGPNRFSTLQECEQVCRPLPSPTDLCSQPPEQGRCRAYMYKWHYDATRDECRQFVYGGCGGNDNKFETREECEGRCKKGITTVGISLDSSTTTTTAAVVQTAKPSTTIAPFDPNELSIQECATPASIEPCGSNITVYYYDTRTEACLVGDFGGCRYLNSYRTEEECERRCGAFKGLDVCGANLDPGPCLASISKYYWDPISGQCLGFAYGGCHGGPNRFSSVEECEEVCGATGPEPACLQPVSTGAPGCGLSSRRWYYHDVTGECTAFVYSGCGGTENNFASYEACAVACKRESPAGPGGNEISCDGYAAECAALRCQYGVQRVRAGNGCVRCVCVPVDVDCDPLRQECDTLKCNYGMERVTGDDGCERCRCIEHPCVQARCAGGERCVTTAYRDALTLELRYSAECRTVNKTGSCPPRGVYSTTEGQCRTECNDDADCVGVGKCCERGCRVCLEPVSQVLSSPAPPHTTFSPDMPYAPRPSEQREPEVKAQEGGRATLRCFLHSNPPPKITWRYGEITIEGDVGRYRLLADGALEIVSLYRNDTGVYICVADNGLGVATQEIRLEVLDPVEGPAGISGTPNAVVMGELGRSLSVRCLAYGFPQPAIYWYRGQNGPMVPYSSSLYEARGNVLQIRKLLPETLGEYICQAYNGYGKPADWAFVVQAYRPEGSEEYPYTVSRQTERAVALKFEPRIAPAPTTARTTEIEIPYSVPVRTHIATDRTRVSAGSEINLPCDVDGFPVPEVYWTKDGVQIQRQPSSDRIMVTEARLTISRANINDSGLYGCHANNGYTSHYSTVQISVEGLYIPPYCKDSPYFANCGLIVKSKFCHHKYYSSFCCKSCVEAGQLDPNEMEMQADAAWRRK